MASSSASESHGFVMRPERVDAGAARLRDIAAQVSEIKGQLEANVTPLRSYAGDKGDQAADSFRRQFDHRWEALLDGLADFASDAEKTSRDLSGAAWSTDLCDANMSEELRKSGENARHSA